MSILHTISKSQDSKLLQNCLSVIGEDDAILFIEDGTYHCSVASSLSSIAIGVKLYGLREDMIARAILAHSDDRVDTVDSARFVQLCCDYDKVVSWF